jgi:nicotinamidase-related amidase
MSELPVPAHFDPEKVGEIYRVRYRERASEAARFAQEHDLRASATDELRIGLLLVDVQNTFSLPGFELFVGGRSGRGAVEDNVRLTRFLYRNLGRISRIHATMDTHTAMQIFHPAFLVDAEGRNPEPMTAVSLEDVESGRYRVSSAAADALAGGDRTSLQSHLVHYCRRLSGEGRYRLMVWPYHAMLGGIGHALVSAVEEAIFFHTIARGSQASFEMKGGHPLTENYSVLSPEVLEGPDGRALGAKNLKLLDELLGYDVLVVAGEAKSHCVSWTLFDLLREIQERGPELQLAQKVYLLEDCTSPVVVPGVVDFTDDADRAFSELEDAGMHRVSATEPMESWPSFPPAASAPAGAGHETMAGAR